MVDLSVIWDSMILVWYHCNENRTHLWAALLIHCYFLPVFWTPLIGLQRKRGQRSHKLNEQFSQTVCVLVVCCLSHWPLGDFSEILEIIFKLILVIDGQGISFEIALRWMLLDFIDDKSALVQVMAWCHQAPSCYLSQCWPISMSPYGITRPQCINVRLCSIFTHKLHKQLSPVITKSIFSQILIRLWG